MLKKRLLAGSLALVMATAMFTATPAAAASASASGTWTVYPSSGVETPVEITGSGELITSGGQDITTGNTTTITVNPDSLSEAGIKLIGPDGKPVEKVPEKPKAEPPVETEQPVRKLYNNYQTSIPRIDRIDETTVYLKPVAKCEYSLGGEVWQAEPVFSGLKLEKEYLLYQRFAETDTTLAGPPSDPLAVTLHKESAEKPVEKPMEKPVYKPVAPPSSVAKERVVEWNGKKVWLGMSAKELMNNMGLGTQNCILLSTWNGLSWYVYKERDSELFVGGVSSSTGTLRSMFAVGKLWKWNGIQGYTKYEKEPELSKAGKKDLTVILGDEPELHVPYAIRLYEKLAHGSLTFDAAALEAESQLIMYLSNTYRELNGLSAQEWCDKAATAAFQHSDNMAKNNFFSHLDPQRKRAINRLNGLGVIPRCWAENIAAGQLDGMEAFMDWISSPGHRKNILIERNTKIGVGGTVCAGSDYYVYWTQVFYG